MWPWTHLAFGYLLVSLLWRLRANRVTGAVAVAAAVGTQFPDLVDKPLAWGLGVLPAGRSLAHSVVTAVPLSAVVLYVATRRGRSGPALAFVVGYGSHLVGDTIPKLPSGDFDSLTFLLWPLLPLPEYDGAEPVVANLSEVVATPVAFLLASPGRLALLALVIAVWWADGFPGVAGVGRYVTRGVNHDID
ncbi:metal-dependent hydrolase [Haloarcula sediminis]|uniref:metal-dependent hydrolase n=1 Tax=Haloarcula sediminis TaxID=3111777 RepID=UPI002D77142E|nr:metal-dependent hydrolase [Haloarcula sp. CK38]